MTEMGMKFHQDIPIIEIEIQEVMESQGGKDDVFEGEYEIIPKAQEQVLDTKDKIMKNDLVIKKIPTYQVSNDFGTTFIIGGN